MDAFQIGIWYFTLGLCLAILYARFVWDGGRDSYVSMPSPVTVWLLWPWYVCVAAITVLEAIFSALHDA